MAPEPPSVVATGKKAMWPSLPVTSPLAKQSVAYQASVDTCASTAPLLGIRCLEPVKQDCPGPCRELLPNLGFRARVSSSKDLLSSRLSWMSDISVQVFIPLNLPTHAWGSWSWLPSHWERGHAGPLWLSQQSTTDWVAQVTESCCLTVLEVTHPR